MPDKVAGQMAAFPQPNVDTDVIMPKRFLKTITRQGLADGTFADLRFDEQGNVLSAFVLNKEDYRKASILVVGGNFGCGSSREHAVWGLRQLGIEAVIGTDFGGIFYDNARKNGLVLPIVSKTIQTELLARASKPDVSATIDIASKTIAVDGSIFEFEMDTATRQALLEERDETLDTLSLSAQIKAYERDHFKSLRVKVAR